MARSGIGRRRFAVAIAAGALAPWDCGALAKGKIVIGCNSEIEACAEAAIAIQTVLNRSRRDVLVLDVREQDSARRLRDAAEDGSAAVGVAVGAEPLNVLLQAPSLPVIATMVLSRTIDDAERWPGRPSRIAGAICLDVPPAEVLSRVKGLFPATKRIGLIRTEAVKPALAALENTARQKGLDLQVADCSGPEGLVAAFLSLRKRVDFVICLPDSAVYTSLTVKPLIMASLENRLPVAGFSSSFARAGAAVAIFPDFTDVGRQTGELVERLLAGHGSAARQGPRRVQAAVNLRVLRLLGIDYAGQDSSAVIYK